MNTRTHSVILNGKPASEFTLFSNAAATYGVPTVLVSGDQGLMQEVKTANANISYVSVKAGKGASAISMSPAAAQEAITNGVEKSLLGDLKRCLVTPPTKCILDVTYVTPDLAYEKSFYPGVKHIGNRTNRIETDNFFDVMRAMRFIK